VDELSEVPGTQNLLLYRREWKPHEASQNPPTTRHDPPAVYGVSSASVDDRTVVSETVDSETEGHHEQRKPPLPLNGIPSGSQQRFIRVDSSQPREVRNNKETPLKVCAEFNMKPQEPNGMSPTGLKSHEQDAKISPLFVQRWEPHDDGAGASPPLKAFRVQPAVDNARSASLHDRSNAVNEMVDSKERRQ
jgi:hypothetical protein